MAGRRAAIVVLALAACSPATQQAHKQQAAAPTAGNRLIVWPHDPTITSAELTSAGAAVREAGYEPLGFEAIGEPLREAGVRAAADEAQALDSLQTAFAAARARFLKQDFPGMEDVLASAEIATLPVLAQPRHVAALWELEFQRGLAELSRNASPGRRFELTLALDETRAPKRDLYGPVVLRAFTEAADARAGVPLRPVVIRATPRDARVVVDGVPVADNAAPRAIRPGLHVVMASAPGYASRATIVELAASQPIEIALDPRTGSAVERIGAAWANASLDPAGESGRRAIQDAAHEAGAIGAVVIELDRSRGGATARLVIGDDSTVERRPTLAAAIRAVFGERSVAARPPHPHDRRPSILRSRWLWAAVGGVAIAGAGVLVYTSRGEDIVRILPPP